MIDTVVGILIAFLAIVLVAAAAHKMIERGRVATAAAGLMRQPIERGRVLSLTAAGWEAASAILLLITHTRTIGAVSASLLWLVYGGLVWSMSAHGAAFDCGCTFGGKRRHSVVSPWRPFALSFMALAVWAVGSTVTIGLESMAAAVAAFCLYLSAGELLGSDSSRGHLAGRLG
jgi:hypothetical protein